MTSSTRQWQKSGIFISLVLALLLWVSSQPAAAQNGILVSEDSVLLNFPNTIEFNLSASSGATIDNITLTYGTNARSCQSSGSRQNMQFDAAEEVEVDWEWELKRSGAIPPGARIWWEWKLTDSEGNSHTTERQEMVISDDRHDWRSSSRDGVTVNWFRGSSAFGEETLALSLESLDRLSEQIGVDPSEEIQFWLYPTAEEVREAIVISSEWAGAVAFTDYNIMIVSLAPGEEQWAADVIPHELTHVVVGMASFNCQGGYLPVWLNEGLSVYGEGTADPSALSGLENALQEERLPSLVSLADGFSAYGGSARQAYDQSGEAVRYLIDQFGPEQMDAFLAAIRSGLTINPALEEVYGFDTGGLDARWRLSLGYVATPTSAAASAQAAATPTLVPTIGLVAPPVMATPTTAPTTTPAPATATATARPDPTATDIPSTATVAEVVAVITQTPADQKEAAVAAIAGPEGPAENGSSGLLLWIVVIGVVVLAAAIILIRVFR
jgi:hypothetical protein